LQLAQFVERLADEMVMVLGIILAPVRRTKITNPELVICRELLKGVCGRACSLEKIEEAERQMYMTADQVKELLPFIEAFANKKPLQYRNKSLTGDWSTINPETTEFRFEHLTAYDGEWRIPESQDD
jgi:hypothetical protein